MDKLSPSLIQPSDLYIFQLLNIDYVLLDVSEIQKDGTVILTLDTDKIPKPNFDTDDEILQSFMDGDDYQLAFSPEKGIVESLTVERMAVQHGYDYIYTITLNVMEFLHHPEYQSCKQVYDIFNEMIMEWVKSQIRDVMIDVRGQFVNDTIARDTYFQKRIDNQTDIYYGIHSWWNKVHKGSVCWTDVVNGEGTVYIARDD